MKVIIVGGGVAGLSAYLQLNKLFPRPSPHEITIYEAHPPGVPAAGQSMPGASSEPGTLTDSSAVVGNVIALIPATLRLLRHIDQGLYDLLSSRGYRNETYRFRTARGHHLGLKATDDSKLPREGTISCPRALLRDCLLEIVGERNVQYRKVVTVHLSGKKPRVCFADGREETADLVIGADGVRSVVKTAIFGREDDAMRFNPHYEGFCGVGGFLEMDLPALASKTKSAVFTFGPSGSFGYCSVAPEEKRTLGWWSNWGQQKAPVSNMMEPHEIRKQLQDRHGAWKDPVIRYIIANTKTDRIYPIWTTPDLPCWGTRGAVLLGDAAHTLPATSGQGAGQALEDSVVFSLLLAAYLHPPGDKGSALSEAEAIGLATKGLYEIQQPPVAAIKRQSRNLYLRDGVTGNVFVEYGYYFYLFLLTNLPILSRLILGTVFNGPETPDAEERVRRFLTRETN